MFRLSRSDHLSEEEFSRRFVDASPRLLCVALGIVRNRELAEDVVQEAAIVAYEKRREFDPQTNFSAWAIQITRFIALRMRRKEIRRQGASLDQIAAQPAEESRGQWEGSSADIIAGRVHRDDWGLTDQVVAALDRLEEMPRICFLLRVLLDLSYREIADSLDIPEGTAASHVHRTRRTLFDLLDPTGATQPAREESPS